MARHRTITRKNSPRSGCSILHPELCTDSTAAVSSNRRAQFIPRRRAMGIGDVVLSTALLRALRANFGQASITLLAKPYAAQLLEHSGLTDRIVAFDFPWTAFSGKFSPTRYVPKEFQDLIRGLRSCDFDVSIDARRDIRSNVITYLAGARRRIGYDFGGGEHLLTDVLPSGSQDDHKVSDWLTLLRPLGIEPNDAFTPALVVTESEKELARRKLHGLGLSPSSSRWSSSLCATISAALGRTKICRGDRTARQRPQGQVIVFEERTETRQESLPRLQSQEFRGICGDSWLSPLSRDLLLCSDSGPMHIANALDIR